jgi:hypothetical protein
VIIFSLWPGNILAVREVNHAWHHETGIKKRHFARCAGRWLGEQREGLYSVARVEILAGR